MDDRIIHFEKIPNARDMGGLRTAGGRIISFGLMIRSANLSNATQTDIKVLRNKYHLAKIIDLRTDAERNEMPDIRIEGAEYITIPIFDSAAAGISHEKETDSESLLAVVPKMEELYFKMVTDKSCLNNLGKAACCVMEHDFLSGSVLWHCTVGKDRCGLLSAVLLLALGVERNSIMKDYLLTNLVNAPKAENYYKMMLEAGKTKTEAETIRNILLAKEEYLNAAFSVIESQYKSADAFLHDGLNISQRTIDKFKSRTLD